MVDLKELQSITDPLLLLEKIKTLIVPILIISLVSLLFTTIFQYYIIFNPLNSENNIIVSAIKSLNYFIPYLIIMVLLAFVGFIAIVLGVFVLIVGAFFAMLYIMTLYLLILPIMMVEETNIANTITRTISLAHRKFWSNIGWVAVFIIIMIVISVIFSALILLPFTGSLISTIGNPDEASNLMDMTTNPLFFILSAIVNALTLPLMPIFACILYFNGKASEEEQKSVTADKPDDDRVRIEDLYAKPYSDDHPENPETKDLT